MRKSIIREHETPWERGRRIEADVSEVANLATILLAFNMISLTPSQAVAKALELRTEAEREVWKHEDEMSKPSPGEPQL